MNTNQTPNKETENISIRIEKKTKKEAEYLFNEIGLNMTTAITLFLKKAVATQSIPFELSYSPNAETLAAMREAEEIAALSKRKRYLNFDELIKDVEDDE